MYRRKYLPAMIALFFLVAMISCAGRRQASQQQADTPESLYLRGLDHLERDELQNALDQFEKARILDPSYVPAYEGMGRVALAEGEILQAQEHFEAGLQRDADYAPLYIGMGRVLKGRQLGEEAIGQFQQALQLDPQCADAYYYLAKTYVDLELYSLAEEAFKKTLDRDPSHVRARKDWENLVHLRMPPDEPPQEYFLIVKKPMISRADWAALLAHQLPLSDLCDHRGESVEAADAVDSWARREIRQVISCGLMQLSEAGGFQPAQKITRLGCAQILARVLSLRTGEPHLSDKFGDSESPFPDLSKDHPAFGAVMLVTTRGIMSTQAGGGFAPDETVNGYRAIKIIDALKEAIR